MLNEDWPILLSFFPNDWIELALKTEALKKLRKDKDAENYIRTLLIHLASGYSMRETVTRAKLAGLADISDVAFMGRLKKAKDWLHSLCVALFEEQGYVLKNSKDPFQVRIFDATNVKEPGATGSQWRIHYSVRLPSLVCDFFKITAAKGHGTGESFFQYSIKNGDYIIADRGYSTASGIHHVVSKNAFMIVRVNTGGLAIVDKEGGTFSLLEQVTDIKKAGVVRSWPVLIPKRNGNTIEGRICAVRKTEEAIKAAHKKLRRKASKNGHTIAPETMEYAKYVIIFTNYPQESFSDVETLQWYRSRWQVELIFKKFKSIAQLGHLPKHSDDSSKAWLYGKLFVALLTEKLVKHASSVSPWGYELEEQAICERLA